MFKRNLWMFGRFSVVGIANTFLTYVVYALLYHMIGSHSAIVVGYLAGLVNSYVWNSKWTFQTRLERRQITLFVVVNLLLLGLNETGYTLLIHVVHSPLGAQAVNAALMAVIGYFANRWFVFTPARETEAFS